MKHITKTTFLVIMILILCSCNVFVPKPTETPIPTATSTFTATATTTYTPTFTPTATATRRPRPTHTSIPTETVTLTATQSLSAFSGTPKVTAMNEECRRVIDGINLLKEGDFKPSQYFEVHNDLRMQPGYVLDYVYFSDDLGGKPLVYARKSYAKPFETYDEYLASINEVQTDERSYSDRKSVV
jgi:hypothetical protein